MIYIDRLVNIKENMMFINIKILTFSTNTLKLCRIMKVIKGPKSSNSKTGNSLLRAKLKSIPNTSKKIIRVNLSKMGSSITLYRYSIAILPSLSCKLISISFRKNVNLGKCRWRKILRGKDH